MKFTFAKTIFYVSLVTITIFTLTSVFILLQSRNVEGPEQLELTTQAPEASTVTISPTPISLVDITNWSSEISAYLNVSFKYPPSWTQVLTQRDIIAHTTKEENPRGVWIAIFDNPNDMPLKDWWNSQFIRSGVSLSDTTVDNREAILEVPNQVGGNRETMRTYVKKDDVIYEIRIIIFAGYEEDKEIAKLVIGSLKFL